MSKYSAYIILLVIITGWQFNALAQTVVGTIIDMDSKELVPNITITNKRTMQSVHSSAEGVFYINALLGDTLLLSHPAYMFSTKTVSMTMTREIFYVTKRRHELEEVEVLSDMAKYKKDSADKYIFYRKTLKDAGQAPNMNFSNGIGVDGLFSSLALKVSGKKKKAKKFAQMLERDEQTKFTNVRYNVKLVMSQTGLSEDEAMNFIMQNPIPYDYVRAASEVEIQMWIRENYKKWKERDSVK
jgi:NACalpha-BTF3-like transcription factor